MKSVLISIQPKWCELIANGKKTIEVRKTRPKKDEPFKCYIYETKAPRLKYVFGKKDYEGYAWFDDMDENEKCFVKVPQGKGKVIGEFVCRNIYDIECSSDDHNYFSKNGTCLTVDEIIEYCNGKILYGWHISDLVIYDKPKELSEFFHYCGDNPKCDGCEAHYYSSTECGTEDYCCSVVEGCKPLTRPPQSWCYVEGE